MIFSLSNFFSKYQITIRMNNGAGSRSGWTKIQETYKNVHPNLVLVVLFMHTKVECMNGLFICGYWGLKW